MSDPSGPRRSAVLTAVPMVMVVGLFVGIVRKSSGPVDNLDTYFHLRLGREFLDGWLPWDPGQVSTFAHADWVPTQWLSQVVLAASERWFGLPGVAWLVGAMVLSYALVVYRVCRSLSSPTVAAVIAPIATLVSYLFLSGRPQVLSFIFVVVVVGAWLRASGTGRPPLWLVPLTWLWAMCHGMWPVGVIVSASAVLGLWLDRRHDPTLPPVAWRWAIAVPIGSALVTAITPVGPRLVTGVIRVGGISDYFAEWRPTSITSPLNAPVALLLAVLLLMLVRGRRASWVELFLLLQAAGWLVYSERTVPVAAAMLAPMLALRLAPFVPDRALSRRRENGIVLGGFALSLVALALVVPHVAADPVARPAWQLRAMDELAPGTPVVNDWDDGAFDIWRWPDLDFVMHGYGDVFTAEEIERNSDINSTAPAWDDLVRDTGARVALVVESGRLAYQLQLLGWTSEHDARDGDDMILRAPADW